MKKHLLLTAVLSLALASAASTGGLYDPQAHCATPDDVANAVKVNCNFTANCPECPAAPDCVCNPAACPAPEQAPATEATPAELCAQAGGRFIRQQSRISYGDDVSVFRLRSVVFCKLPKLASK